MKITLDIDRLLADGEITPEEYDRFKRLAARDTASLALNIVVAFGVIAVAGGALALMQSATASIALGAAVALAGVGLGRLPSEQWRPLGVVLLLVGALMLGGGVVVFTEGSALGFAGLCVAFGVGALLARSGLLASLSALSLLAASGPGTATQPTS